jgi:hypothetical protein
MTRYNLSDRPVPSGSMEPRLNPRAHRELNTRLGPQLPEPLVRETTGRGAVNVGSNAVRQRLAGLPGRFIKD